MRQDDKGIPRTIHNNTGTNKKGNKKNDKETYYRYARMMRERERELKK